MLEILKVGRITAHAYCIISMLYSIVFSIYVTVLHACACRLLLMSETVKISWYCSLDMISSRLLSFFSRTDGQVC